MTNTIPNVPRELKPCPFCGSKKISYSTHQIGIAVGCDSCGAVCEIKGSKEQCAEAWNTRAPSPAGVDGLEVVGLSERIRPGIEAAPWVCDEVKKLEAIIDGLLGDVAAQEETANQWRELALQFDRHRMTAMAHIRAAASGDKSAIEALGVFAALPPIPGHEITAERDELLAEVARRGVKYMELAGKYDLACVRRDKLTGLLRMIASRGLSPLLTEHELEQIDAALSAGKEGE